MTPSAPQTIQQHNLGSAAQRPQHHSLRHLGLSGNQNSKPDLNMSDQRPRNVNPQQWLNFSLPPRRNVPGSGGALGGVPRRSRRGDTWRGGPMSRERYVHSNFRFVLKPTEVLSYGAHFADPDISLHWPHILQILVPTFSAFSVAQGYVSSESAKYGRHSDDEDMAMSLEDEELEGMGEESARIRQRMEEERRGRMCPICLGKPVAGRMTKCGHIFCFPCVLHYIRLSEIPGSAKCPICGDTVHEGMLKSVKYLDAGDMVGSAAGNEGDGQISTATSSIVLQIDTPTPTTAPSEHRHHDHGEIGHMEGIDDHNHHDDIMQRSEPQEVKDDRDAEPHHLIHMRLIVRPQMTTLALPASTTYPSDAIPPHTAPFIFLPDVLAYSRFMLATPGYMLDELNRELGELQKEWEMLKGDELGREFVRAAKEKVERQVGKVKGELMVDTVRRNEKEARENWVEAVGGEFKEREIRRERERKEKERKERVASEEMKNDDTIPHEYLRTTSQNGSGTFDTYADIPPNRPVSPNPMPSSIKRNRRKPNVTPTLPSTPPAPAYYFYQSSLGANVFLSPLDIRILLAHFNSYSNFPATLSFPSVGFDPTAINDEMRKRYKYLSHLPTGTEVIFVEAELEAIVGKEGLVAFEQPLKARKAKRRQRVAKEDRAKVKWEKLEKERNPSIGLGREERDLAMAVDRSKIENTLNWTANYDGSIQVLHDGNGLATSLGSTSSLDGTRRVSSSPGTAIWGTSPLARPTFATALHAAHSASSPSIARRPGTAAAMTRPPGAALLSDGTEGREGTAEDENEWDRHQVWDRAFGELGSRSRGNARIGDSKSEGAVADDKLFEGGGAGGGRKKGREKKVLVLGGGGPRARGR